MRYKVGLGASQVVLVVKNPPAGEVRDTGSIPGLGRSPGGGNGNSLQCSCLGNPMDRGAWQVTWGHKGSMGSQRVRHDLIIERPPALHK